MKLLLLGEPIEPPPEGYVVAALVVAFPGDEEDHPKVSLFSNSQSALATSGVLNNSGEAIDEAGVYVVVLDGQERPVFLSRVGDPTISRGEGLSLDDAERADGKLTSTVSRTSGGVLGIRIPFFDGAIVAVFRVDRGAAGQANSVEEPLLLSTGFPGSEIPAQGWSFEVDR